MSTRRNGLQKELLFLGKPDGNLITQHEKFYGVEFKI